MYQLLHAAIAAVIQPFNDKTATVSQTSLNFRWHTRH